MWRFFRLGIKSGTCPGNQTHFRIIGTTCANADCDDKTDEFTTCTPNVKDILIHSKENLASRASKKFQKSLQYQENISHKKTKYYEHQKSEVFRKPLKEVDWKNYISVKDEILNNNSSSNKSLPIKYANRNCSDSDPKFVYNDEDFGSLSKDNREFEQLPDEKDDDKEIFEPRLSVQNYGRKILQLCKEKKLKEALEVLEIEMKGVSVVPNNYCYNILINACGKMGYTEKAFSLYYQLKRRGLKPEKFAYTGLFNACANSPFKDTGLELAKTLRKQLKDKEILLHPITYNAMIKAFGHCNDIKSAFEIVDELINDGHAIKTETMNFLLHACVSHKESGFRHALMVWRKMRALLITPDIYSYNLLLRCVKECGAGDARLLDQLFDDAKENQKLKGRAKRIRETTLKSRKSNAFESSSLVVDKTSRQVSVGNSNNQNRSSERDGQIISENMLYQIGDRNEIVKVNLAENMEMEIVSREANTTNGSNDILPNVLSYHIHPGSIVSISSLEKQDERLWLLGGVSGILESMKEDKVRPTVATFTFILESLPSTKEVEEMLLTSMANCSVKPDVIFFNKLIIKRCMRKEYSDAKDVLELMQKHRVCMDIVSFGCLALSCYKPSDINQLLRDMAKAGFTPNEELMGTLLQNCLVSREYVFAIELLERLKSYGMIPNEIMLGMLERTRAKIKKQIITQETEGDAAILSQKEKRKREEMRVFLMEYKFWLKKSQVNFKDHPWAQFGYEDKGGKDVVKHSAT